jgi:putative ATP-binding cassette transporter
MRTTKRLNVGSTFYAQFAIIFPFLVGAPRYFAGTITLGGLMQISSAFGQVQTALSWFVNAFDSLASWKASANRLAGFHEAVQVARTQVSGIDVTSKDVDVIQLDQLALALPNGQALNRPFCADIEAGERILVMGPSGCGKSTLFRALAGIWPYGSGSIQIPAMGKLFFVPQKAYLPIGTLREAIAYPAPAKAYKDAAIQHYLDLCRLPHLKDKLDQTDNWSQRLSPGEQQRLSFVRVLLAQPEMLFLDEATSALDAATEQALYELVLDEMPDITLVSIAHREVVAKYHRVRWQFAHDSVAANQILSAAEAPRYTIQRSLCAEPSEETASSNA